LSRNVARNSPSRAAPGYTPGVSLREPRNSTANVAFRKAALSHLESLHRFANHLSRDQALSDDLVQETFLLALRSEHTFNRSLKDIRPWLFKILNNALRQHFRRKSGGGLDEAVQYSALSDSREDSSANSEVLAPNSRLADLNWDQVDDALKDAIDALPDALRSVFLLFAVEDLKYREIAEVEGIPPGTVMSRLSRARQLLMQSLAANPSTIWK